ncbi:MerR family DNA-binding transcriptional regulator [Streptomyces sp. NPDC002669]|uniref:MerR family DNA-binding transcriptional regulator n=1 Tax=Streptomyces sp. NPDC002669 TaxID=3364658 RepID=UPI0036B9D453
MTSGRTVGPVEDHWTVGRVAEPAGVIVRTLHHYDEIGLVRPSARTAGPTRRVTWSGFGRCRPTGDSASVCARSQNWSATPRPTRSRTCAGCAACCWSDVTVPTPWWRPSTGNSGHGRRDWQ